MTPAVPGQDDACVTIRRRSNGRGQAFSIGPDQTFHRLPSSFQTRAADNRDTWHPRRVWLYW